MKKVPFALLVCLFFFQKLYSQCPPVAPVISGGQTICAGAVASYYVKTDFPANYVWSISGGGGFFSGPNTGSLVRVTWTTAGTYNVNVTSTSGCTTVYSYPVTVVSSPSTPPSPVVTGPASACFGSSALPFLPKGLIEMLEP